MPLPHLSSTACAPATPSAWPRDRDPHLSRLVTRPRMSVAPRQLSEPGTSTLVPSRSPPHLFLVNLLMTVLFLPGRSVQTFADKSKQEALKNDLVEALKRKQQC